MKWSTNGIPSLDSKGMFSEVQTSALWPGESTVLMGPSKAKFTVKETSNLSNISLLQVFESAAEVNDTVILERTNLEFLQNTFPREHMSISTAIFSCLCNFCVTVVRIRFLEMYYSDITVPLVRIWDPIPRDILRCDWRFLKQNTPPLLMVKI